MSQSTEDGERPEIVSYRGAVNQYQYNFDVVTLDSRLDEYPEAKEVIKKHELEHADARTAREYLCHEFKSDVRLYFSTADEMKEVREYYNETEHDYTLGRLTQIGMSYADVLRSFWLFLTGVRRTNGDLCAMSRV